MKKIINNSEKIANQTINIDLGDATHPSES